MSNPDSSSLDAVRADLIAEQDALDRLIAEFVDGVGADDLGAVDEVWSRATPSPRWSVADQVGHLAFFDDTAALAILDPEGFRAHAAELISSMSSELAVEEATLGRFREMSPAELVVAWRGARAALRDAAAGLGDGDRVIWYGPSMGSKSFLTARLMECWAHGLDIADALGVVPEATDRIRHVVRLGVITRGWSFTNRGLDAPTDEVRVELVAPSGERWEFGAADVGQRISGPAVDFCQVVTQRRKVGDTALVVEGDSAAEWMRLAQCFAGPPT